MDLAQLQQAHGEGAAVEPAPPSPRAQLGEGPAGESVRGHAVHARPQGLQTPFSDRAILLETCIPKSRRSSNLQNHHLELILKLHLRLLVAVKNLSPHLQLKCYLG